MALYQALPSSLLTAVVVGRCGCLSEEAGYLSTFTSSSTALLRRRPLPQQQQLLLLLLLLHCEGEETNDKDEGGRITGVGGTIHRCVGGREKERSCCKGSTIINFWDGQKV